MPRAENLERLGAYCSTSLSVAQPADQVRRNQSISICKKGTSEVHWAFIARTHGMNIDEDSEHTLNF